MALRHQLAEGGERIVLMAGIPFGTAGSTNVLHVVRLIGDELDDRHVNSQASVIGRTEPCHICGRQRLDFRPRALVASMNNRFGKTFASFFQAGFECSSHRRRDGVRLDLIRATGHDRHVLRDYRLCKRARLRHHPRRAALASDREIAGQIRLVELAARARGRGGASGSRSSGTCSITAPPITSTRPADDFPERFTDFALAALEVQQSVSGRPPIVCPLNEINFLSWAVDDGYFPRVGPDERGWFKRQLVRTAITSARAIKQRWPSATIVWAEPLIHIAPHDRRRRTVRAARENLQGMFEAYDWIMGMAEPELGGDPSLVDLIGLNFYPHNQWYYEGPTIPMGHHEYRPLADMLVEMAERYEKPIFLSETGAEGSAKPSWLHYVCNEVRERDDSRRRRSRASAGIRSPLTPAGTIRGTPRPGLLSTDRGGRQPPRRPAAARGVRSAAARSLRCRGSVGGNQVIGAVCGSSDGVPTKGQPSRHWMRSISRIRRLLISSSCRWRGRFTSIAW